MEINLRELVDMISATGEDLGAQFRASRYAPAIVVTGSGSPAMDEIHPRAAKYRAETLKDLVAHLHSAQMLANRLGIELDGLQQIKEGQVPARTATLAQPGTRAGSKPRRRPDNARQPKPRDEYYMFLDECGNHNRSGVSPAFPRFCLRGAIVAKRDDDALDAAWKAWKSAELGSPDVIVHEPDVRTRNSTFRGSSREHADTIAKSLELFLSGIEVHYIAAVVDFREFEALYPESMVDDFLPRSCYLMTIDFVM